MEAAGAGEEFFEDRENSVERLASTSPSAFLPKPNFFMLIVDYDDCVEKREEGSRVPGRWSGFKSLCCCCAYPWVVGRGLLQATMYKFQLQGDTSIVPK